MVTSRQSRGPYSELAIVRRPWKQQLNKTMRPRVGVGPDLRSTSGISQDGPLWVAPHDISLHHYNSGGSSGFSRIFSSGGLSGGRGRLC